MFIINLQKKLDTKLLNNIIKCGDARCARIVHIVVSTGLVLFILFASFGDVFDFAKEGFFSYHGESQYLHSGLFLTWEIQVVLTLILGCKFDKQMAILNENIKGNQIELTGLSGADSMKS